MNEFHASHEAAKTRKGILLFAPSCLRVTIRIPCLTQSREDAKGHAPLRAFVSSRDHFAAPPVPFAANPMTRSEPSPIFIIEGEPR